MLHGRNAVEASPRRNALGSEFLAAPETDDQIRFPRDNLLIFHNTVLRRALISTIGEDVHTAGDLDEFRYPSNSGDQRLVPFLEEYPWPLRQPLRTASRSGQARFERPYELPSPFTRTDHCTQHPDHIEDSGDTSLIRHGRRARDESDRRRYPPVDQRTSGRGRASGPGSC